MIELKPEHELMSEQFYINLIWSENVDNKL